MNIRRIIKSVLPSGVFQRVEPVGHLLEAVFWNIAYGFPGGNMKVIGVTGTNGKTTTTFLIHRMLVESGIRAGLMTTVAWGVGEDITTQLQHYTNVPSRELMQRLRAMKALGVDWLILETTSQALAQHRTWGVPYSIGVLTNITLDHLDYHKTFERYVEAKRQLFRRVERNTRGLQIGIVNADDPSAAKFAATVSRPMSYGLCEADVRAENIKLKSDGLSYTAVTGDESYHITSHLVGSFNVANTLAAVCVGRALGLSREQIEQGIASLQGVAGRMETISVGQDFSVVVDYAHTPDALQSVLTALRDSKIGNLRVVFGATGDRDKTKRPLMGKIAVELADQIYLTDDETFTEDPDTIREAVWKGIKEAGGEKKTQVIPDRRSAIAQAFHDAESHDIVLLAGIGHQNHRVMNEGPLPWDERDIAKELLTAEVQARDSSHSFPFQGK